jgi:hypothetical protein
VEVPGGDEFVGELAADFDLEGSRADGDVADFEVEEGFGARVAAEAVELPWQASTGGMVRCRLCFGFCPRD